MLTPKYYFGNYPNSATYDPNIPIGYNKWDAMEADDRFPVDDEQIDDEETDWEEQGTEQDFQ